MRLAAMAARRIPGAVLAALLIPALPVLARDQVTINPASLNFPPQTVGVPSAPVNLVLTNTGSRRAAFSGVFVSSPAFV
jgi:hypothetical protein